MKRDELCIISLVLAFVGLIYEFVFAQALTIVFGNTHQQYALTIGIFTFGLGIGALTFDLIKQCVPSPQKLFVWIQSALMPMSIFGLWAILYWEHPILSYVPILMIAFLTGFELPLLMEMAPDAASSIEILSYDFGGMFIATMLFPFFLLPELGIFATLNVCLALNLGSMLYISGKNRTRAEKVYASAIFVFIILGLSLNSQIIEYFGNLLTE